MLKQSGSILLNRDLVELGSESVEGMLNTEEQVHGYICKHTPRS